MDDQGTFIFLLLFLFLTVTITTLMVVTNFDKISLMQIFRKYANNPNASFGPFGI